MLQASISVSGKRVIDDKIVRGIEGSDAGFSTERRSFREHVGRSKRCRSCLSDVHTGSCQMRFAAHCE